MKRLILLSLIISACSSNHYKVRQVDNAITVYGNIDDEKIGVDNDRQVIIQKERTAEAELKIQDIENSDNERRLELLYQELFQCRKDVADTRLGGNGKPVEIPEVDNMKSASEVKEQIGLTSTDELKVVKREFYLDRLKAARQYAATLKEMSKTLSKFNSVCQQEMATARVKAGLASTRYEAKGRFNNGVWIQERKKEVTLDDAFEIKNTIPVTTTEEKE
ncbi:MAG: hypothetical protein EB078_10230 [Proteobacteria bacterium]|nr:hypothetical protein [Pseudomonadota bacterium]NDD05272.1 hypothetical protein [Pseudomonadota bacterium]